MAPKTVSVTVKYARSGTQPPIYLAGSFSDPAWQPQEMLYTTNESNEHEFYKEVQVEEGREYQYKFRVGEGDWWLLNEDSPTATDDAGNRNNLLSVPVSEEPTTTQQKNSEHSTISTMEHTASHPAAEMENTNPEATESEKNMEAVPIDTHDEEDVKEFESSNGPSDFHVAEEHTTITPAHTNTPAEFETVENKEEEHIPSHAPEDREVLKEVEYSNGAADIPSSDNVVANSAPEIDDNVKAQLVADSTGPSNTSDGPKSTEEQIHATEAPLAPPIHPGNVEPTSTPAIQAGEDSSKLSEIISSPALVVEKVDDELRHGDDFGSAATVTQKDDHLLHSQDAEPDHVVLRTKSRTPELAETAAEVSESAAMLDIDPPTPPISDEEAGVIGYRRMSSTPIPQVAKTAVEVADVAATLDEGEYALQDISEPTELTSLRDDDEEHLVDSGTSTPASQRAPKFAYECLGPDDTEPPTPAQTQPVDSIEPVPSRYEEAVEIDWNDPSIEMFPTDRAAILDRLKRISERMPEDVAEVEVVPASPIVGPNHHPERQLPAASPNLIAHEVSPSLDSITEENDEIQETLVSLPGASKLVLPGPKNETPALSKGLNDSAVVLNAVENTHPEIEENSDEPAFTGLAGNGQESNTEASKATVEMNKPVAQSKEDEVKSAEEAQSEEVVEGRELSTMSESKGEESSTENPEKVLNVEIPQTSNEPELSVEDQIKDKKTNSEEEKRLPAVELPPGSGKPELTLHEEDSKGLTENAEDASVEVQEVSPETPPPAPVEQTLYDSSSEKPHAILPPITSFVVDSKQLSHSEEDKVLDITTGVKAPNITVQPATPGSSNIKTNLNLNPLDAAKTTAIEEENGRSQVTARKQPRSQSPERPITPTSMRSTNKDTKSKNFLKVFWHVVFVDWIGGLIRALCGGGRGRYTLLAVGTIVLVALAPTLYSSVVGSSLWE